MAWKLETSVPWTVSVNLGFSNIIARICYIADGTLTFYKYDLNTATFTVKTSPPYSQRRHLVYRGTKVYMPGEPGTSDKGEQRLMIFNTVDNTWTSSAQASPGGVAYYFKTFVFYDDDTVYAIGRTFAGTYRMLKYVISTNTWTVGTNTTTLVCDTMAINTAKTIIYGGVASGGFWTKYTIATDTFADQGDCGYAFALCTDSNKLWLYAESSPWAKGYLDTSNDTIYPTIFVGNASEDATGHNRFGVNDTQTQIIVDAEPDATPARIYSNTLTKFPSDATTRVTGLVHRWSPGHYSLEIFLGDTRTDWGTMMPTVSATPIPTTPTVPKLPPFIGPPWIPTVTPPIEPTLPTPPSDINPQGGVGNVPYGPPAPSKAINILGGVGKVPYGPPSPSNIPSGVPPQNTAITDELTKLRKAETAKGLTDYARQILRKRIAELVVKLVK